MKVGIVVVAIGRWTAAVLVRVASASTGIGAMGTLQHMRRRSVASHQGKGHGTSARSLKPATSVWPAPTFGLVASGLVASTRIFGLHCLATMGAAEHQPRHKSTAMFALFQPRHEEPDANTWHRAAQLLPHLLPARGLETWQRYPRACRLPTCFVYFSAGAASLIQPMPSPPNVEESPQLTAAIDLGSNSFHMVVARLDGGDLKIIDRMREQVRLAGGLDKQGTLHPDVQERALACLARFGERLSGMPKSCVRVVGTNTLRKAKDSAAFIAKASQALGYQIEVISGREEARLIYLGVAQSTPALTGQRLAIDIGGGSTEVIVGDGFKIVAADSLYMGCVSFSRRFFAQGLTNKAFREAQLAASLELQSIARNYRELGWLRVSGCSGTLHAIAGILEANQWSELGICNKGLKKLRKTLIAAETVENVDIPGLQEDRKPVIAGGVAIAEAIFRDLRIDCMLPSPGALREGLLYDLVGRLSHEDVRDRTIKWFQDKYHVDRMQAERVEETVIRMLDQAEHDWELDSDWAGRSLRWTARLHEIGLAINHTGYHKHGSYLVRNSHMAGFSRGEQHILAAILGSQRRKLRNEVFAEIPPYLTDDVAKLCVLFRLAVRLNRSRGADLPVFALRVKKKKIELRFEEGYLDQRPLTLRTLEQEARYLAAVDWALKFKSVE
jgi:exopolyphosphatase / guanosine-5'-triphosphate,3'-diphosphate pyrophosphatase